MSSPRLRHGRHSESGLIYVITTVIRGRHPLLRHPPHARIVMAELERCQSEALARSLAWVVMPDHVHWMFQLHHTHLSDCVGRFKSRSARAINTTRGSHGPIWQSGFHDHGLRTHEDLAAQARYIALNPVRGGLVTTLAHYPYWYCRWITNETEL